MSIDSVNGGCVYLHVSGMGIVGCVTFIIPPDVQLLRHLLECFITMFKVY